MDRTFKSGIFLSDVSTRRNWKKLLECENVNEGYTTFLDKFSQMYNNFFPIKKMKLKSKDLESLWIILGIEQFLKDKQQPYNKYLKNRIPKNESGYKDYKTFFKIIEMHSRKNYFFKLIVNFSSLLN